MPWIEEALEQLAADPRIGYHRGASAASEPVSLAAMALLAGGRADAAARALRWLGDRQADDGSVGVRAGEPTPCWPTSLAVLSWQAAGCAHGTLDRPCSENSENIERAVAWILSIRGKTQPRQPEMGHDSTLVAWPWAAGTHGWIEPTALHVLALKATGHAAHRRTREAVRMLLDRQLPGGGCNYGNTVVLGQTLRPHVQPTGLAMLALIGEPPTPRTRNSLAYLRRMLSPQTSTASLGWALLGLAAHGAVPADAERFLKAAYRRIAAGDRSPYKLALLAHAYFGQASPLISLTGGEPVS